MFADAIINEFLRLNLRCLTGSLEHERLRSKEQYKTNVIHMKVTGFS